MCENEGDSSGLSLCKHNWGAFAFGPGGREQQLPENPLTWQHSRLVPRRQTRWETSLLGIGFLHIYSAVQPSSSGSRRPDPLRFWRSLPRLEIDTSKVATP